MTGLDRDLNTGLNLLRYRLNILDRHLPEPRQRYLDHARSLTEQIEAWTKSSTTSSYRKLFLIDLCGSGSRIWEAWTHGSDPAGDPVFPQWLLPDRSSDLRGLLDLSLHIIDNAFATGGINRIREFTREEVEEFVKPAFQDFIDHQDVVFEIRKPSDPEQMSRFLSGIQFYVFTGIVSSTVLGVSSISGTRVHISEHAFLSTSIKQTIVHELAHNWAVWQQDFSQLLISNRPALLSTNGDRILEGDFIEERLYSKNICFANPFCLNVAPTRNPVAMVKTGPLSEM